MIKYIDLIAYPIMLVVVYILLGILNWDNNPDMWEYPHRVLWVVWGLAWGYGLQRRIAKGGGAND